MGLSSVFSDLLRLDGNAANEKIDGSGDASRVRNRFTGMAERAAEEVLQFALTLVVKQLSDSMSRVLDRNVGAKLRGAWNAGATGRNRKDSKMTAESLASSRGHARGEHVRSTIEKRMRQLKHSWRVDRAEDPVKALHDLRVASRRLRAAVDVLGPLVSEKKSRRARRALRRVTRALGPIREADVKLGMLEEAAANSPDAARHGLEQARHRLEDSRRKLGKRAVRALKKVDRKQLTEDLKNVARAAATLSPDALDTLAQNSIHAAARRVFQNVPPPTEPEESVRWHELRIEAKKLRYALELLLLPAEDNGLIAKVTHLQESLGTFHDLITLRETLSELSRAAREDDSHAADAIAQAAAQFPARQSEAFTRARSEVFAIGDVEPKWSLGSG